MTTIAIVNRFFPPDPAITGQSARELADFLSNRLRGARIRVYATEAKYEGGQIGRAQSNHEVRRFRSYYSGKGRILRLAASLCDGARLAWAASRDAEVVISLTDPPLLGLWMGALTHARSRRWIEWTMDLYPEAFSAAGILRREHLLFQAVTALLRRFQPERYICLGPQQHAFISSTRGIKAPAFILPCGISQLEPGPEPAWRRKHATKLIVAYAGNLGEAHSAEVIEELVIRADRDRITFLLAPFGSKASHLRTRLGTLDGIEWRDHVPATDLFYADAHIASLAADWTHICVPSKAVTAICLGRPVIYAGVPDADTWALLSDASWLIAEGENKKHASADITRVLAELLNPESIAAKTRAAEQLRMRLMARRDQAFEDIATSIDPLLTRASGGTPSVGSERGELA